MKTETFEEAESLILLHWSNFLKWNAQCCTSYDLIFAHLDKIGEDLLQREHYYNDSIYYQVSRFAEDDESARIYRHLRDFGSLTHFNSKKDVYLTGFFRSLIKQLKEMDENQLSLLASSQNNLLEVFLEGKDTFKADPYRNVLDFAFNDETLLTQPDYTEAVLFLRSNLKSTLSAIPWDSIESNGFSKMIRTMIGIIMYAYYALPDTLSKREKSRELLQALKIGYFFGVSYPLIDNIFDSRNILSSSQKQNFANTLVDALSGLDVSHKIPNILFIKELYRCCSHLKVLIRPKENEFIFKYIKIAHLAQVMHSEVDFNSYCITDHIYTKSALKASFIRIAAASLAGYNIDAKYIHDSVVMGLNNQLSDDFEDFTEDYFGEVATPYTLFLKGNLIINPLITTFNYYFFSATFQSDYELYIQTCALRFVETIREFVKRNGIPKYRDFIDRLTSNNALTTKRNILYKLAEASRSSIHLHQETWLLEYLDNIAKEYLFEHSAKEDGFNLLKFKSEALSWIESKILVDELNEPERYALSGTCQRSRPFLCLLMAKVYELEPENLTGLIRAVEYFHTASLVLDDLPSQDNASFRRGKPTLHTKYGESIAQITAISLIAKGYFELGNIKAGDSIKLKVIQYASQICCGDGLCLGQIKDLEQRNSSTASLDKLLEVASLKTGLAIEFCLLAVSILADDSSSNRDNLTLFATYVGIAYQIRDDLNDALNSSTTGKDQFLDRKNNKSSFLHLLRYEKSKQLLVNYKDRAVDMLTKVSLKTSPLREFIEFLFAFA